MSDGLTPVSLTLRQPALASASSPPRKRNVDAWPFLVLLLLGTAHPGGAWAASPPAPSFVGCPADGMSGPVPAPATTPDAPRVPAGAARQLAYYASAGFAVLAPRGWHCIEIYGSGGAVLLVTPRLYTADTIPDFHSLAGPAVELLFLNGENSGRDQVAEVFSRLFPFKHRFIRSVASDLDIVHRFPHGPYAADRMVWRNRAEVDYATPPHRDGMGTYSSRLGPGPDPITGAAILAKANGVDSVVLLNVRLSPGLRGMVPIILAAARREPVGQAR